MAQELRTVENVPAEAAQLAEVAAKLIDADPESRKAVGELASALGNRLDGGAWAEPGPKVDGFGTGVILLAVARALLDSGRTSAPTLPVDERALWEDAGANFEPGAIVPNAATAAGAFADLRQRSVAGDAAMAALLDVDKSRVSQRLRDRSLYAFSHGDVRYFPRWQLVDRSSIPGLKPVLGCLDGNLHPLVVDHWFTTPSVDLEIADTIVSPVVWLATGGEPEVVAALAADL